MNTKTTLILLAMLLGVMGWFVTSQPNENAANAASELPLSTSAKFEKALFDDPPEPDDIVKITCVRAGQEPWVFERTKDDDDGLGDWRLVEPIQSGVPKYELDGLVNRIKNLKYQIKYAAGATESVTVAQAGLDPPKVDVTLTGGGERTFNIQIGKQASNQETYVRLGGAGDIYVVRSSLDTMIKKRVEAYRDKVLFKFESTDAVSLDITHRGDDGGEMFYRLVKHDGDDWVFEKPFSADADDKKVNDALRAMSRLRASDWVDSSASSSAGRFGLATPKLHIEVVCEVKTVIESEGDDEDESESETDGPPAEKVEIHRYALDIAGRGPLGKDTTVYAKVAKGGAVCTIQKRSADKMTPAADTWRNMKICPTKVSGATKIEIETGDGTAVIVKNGPDDWVFESDGGKAEAAVVKELLEKIDSLKALNFVDDIDPTDVEFGFELPQARIVVTVPGRDQPIRLLVGNATDEVARRLYYVRRDESRSVAKVRAKDVATLKRSPLEYRNREIVKLATGDFTRIELTRPNAITGEEESLTLSKGEGATWRITAPIDDDADATAILDLVATLANLRAESVAAQLGELEPFGLDRPAVRVAVHYSAPAMITIDNEGQAGEPATAEADLGIELLIGEVGNKVYVKRSDTAVVYNLARKDYEGFLADYHGKAVFEAEDAEVASLSVMSSGVTHRFNKNGDGWTYAAEPDLPLDDAKVKDLVLQVLDMNLKRYVAYGVTDFSTYGLNAPGRTIRLTTDDGKSTVLLVSAKVCMADRDKCLYAVIKGSGAVFLLKPDVVSRFDISIDDYEKAADS